MAYVRDYKREAELAKKRGEQGTGHDSGSAKRHRLRRMALKVGAVRKGQDEDHIKPISKGGANTLANGRAETPHANRSFYRNPDGSLKRNVAKPKV